MLALVHDLLRHFSQPPDHPRANRPDDPARHASASLAAPDPPDRRLRTAVFVFALTAGLSMVGLSPVVAPHPGFAQPHPAATPDRVAAASASTHDGVDDEAGRLHVVAQHVDNQPNIDGRLHEAAWQRTKATDNFTQYRPNPSAEASQVTRVRILYDDDALYVGATMHTGGEPVTARYLQRDQLGYSDRFTVFIDSYDNDRTAFAFGVNPKGSQVDQLYFNGTQQEVDWDAVWTARAHVTEEGWTAEMRIPFSQLQFEVKDTSEITWGINFFRNVARRDEVHSWVPLDPNTDRFVSLFGTLDGLQNLRSPQNLEIRPYATGRLTRDDAIADTPLGSTNETRLTAGADVEYGVTSSLSLQATVNPDFGQVEADASQINLSAFEQFFPEKRPFFVEGNDVFRVQGPRLFYSRRIGREPAGRVPGSARSVDAPDRTTILGATKLTGRVSGDWQVGGLNAVTSQESAAYVSADGQREEVVVEPTTNYAVARARRTLRSGRTTVGGIVTSTNRVGLTDRLGRSMHRAAYTGGVDASHRLTGDAYRITGSFFGSQVRGSEAAILRTQQSPVHYFQRPDASHLSIDSSRTEMTGWSAEGRVEKIDGRWGWDVGGAARSPGFEVNDLGFMQQTDEMASDGSVRYSRADVGSLFRRLRVQARYNTAWSQGGEFKRGQYDLVASGQLTNHYTFLAAGGYKASALSMTALRGGPALRQQPEVFAITGLTSDSRRDLQVGVKTTGGAEVGTTGYNLLVEPTLRYRLTNRAKISVTPAISLIRASDQYVATLPPASGAGGGPTYLFAQIERRTLSMTTRMTYAFTPRMSLQAYAQPFVAAGNYSRFAEVADPKAGDYGRRFDRFGDALTRSSGMYEVDRGSGSPLRFGDPDFTFRQLRSTLVFRWQYRRGSTLYLVWSREQTAVSRDGTFAPTDDLGALVEDGRNTFAVKLNFWLGR